MTALKSLGFAALGALITVLVLYPTLKETRREQQWGLLLSPEDVKTTCGRPQTDEIYKLTYIDGDKRVELQFYGYQHRMFLQRVNWSSSKGAGDIYQVSREQISESVKYGYVPACLELAAQ